MTWTASSLVSASAAKNLFQIERFNDKPLRGRHIFAASRFLPALANRRSGAIRSLVWGVISVWAKFKATLSGFAPFIFVYKINLLIMRLVVRAQTRFALLLTANNLLPQPKTLTREYLSIC